MIERKNIKIPGKLGRSEARLLARTAIDKGLIVEVLNSTAFIVSNENKTEIFHVNMAGSIGHMAKTITWDKYLTKQLLQRSGVKSPDGITFDVQNEKEDAITFFENSRHKSLVLKPLKGILGANVFLDIKDVDDMLRKCDIIAKRYKVAMLEEQVYGTECRYFVVGGEVRGVIERIPGNVIGDGFSTIEELVAKKMLLEKIIWHLRKLRLIMKHYRF